MKIEFDPRGIYFMNSLSDCDEVEKRNYPDGIEAVRDTTFMDDGIYIGFNLNRFAYTEKLAAEIHVTRDRLNGITGSTYGAEFIPYIEVREKEGYTRYEVYTG